MAGRTGCARNRGLAVPSRRELPFDHPVMARNPFQKTLLGAAVAAVMLLGPAAAGDALLADETILTGRFLDPRAEVELIARRWAHGLELRHGGELVWSEESLLYLSATFGTCRDLGSGLDRVFYATASGGSDGAMTLYLLAFQPGTGFVEVFADGTAGPELGRYFRLPEAPSDPYRLEPVKGMVCAAGEYKARRERGREIHRALTPTEDETWFERDENEDVLTQTLPARELDPRLVRTLFAMHDDLGPGFARWTLAENEDWRFEVVAFYHFYASWGVVLLEEKRTGRWRSIYNVPRGDSKNYLLTPAIEALDPDRVWINPCPTCTNWPSSVLDLRTFRLQPASAGRPGSR